MHGNTNTNTHLQQLVVGAQLGAVLNITKVWCCMQRAEQGARTSSSWSLVRSTDAVLVMLLLNSVDACR